MDDFNDQGKQSNFYIRRGIVAKHNELVEAEGLIYGGKADNLYEGEDDMETMNRAKQLLTLIVLSGLLITTAPSQAQDPVYGGAQTYPQTYPVATPPPPHQSSTMATDFLAGFASFLVTPVYGAFKLAFAGLGAITGGLAWAFSGGDRQVANAIWRPSLQGTYIITPDHLAGRKPIHFIGP